MQTFTFWQLATQYKINIPIVQRDYAQGRNDAKSEEIRSAFLVDLLESLQKDKPLELDFIYGKVEDDTFIPIDGQQRLTTLFLLHWYVATKLDIPFLIKGFSYKTRISARDFCKCLINQKLDMQRSSEFFSQNIKNAPWFFLSWQKDPTVQSMLNMLDSVHEKFKDKDLRNIWINLSRPNNLLPSDNLKLNSLIEKLEENKEYENDLLELKKQPNISFKFLNLEDFKLTDELYLKMNARGKALSDFENFKAWMIGHVDKFSDSEFNQRWQGDDHAKHWHYLIDKSWTDWLWNNKNFNDNKDITNAFDNAAINFVKNIAFINYFLKGNNKNSQNWENVYTKYLNKNDISVFYVKIYKECYNSIDACEFLFNAFNVLSKKQLCLNEFLPKSWGDDNGKFVARLLSSSLFPHKCYLYAIVQFYASDIKRDGFDKRIRVIRNLIENTNINSENFENILKSIQNISSSQNDLIENLRTSLIKGFDTNQIKEEILKLELINKDGDWEKEIIEAENHPLFKGNIGFLLPEGEYSKIVKFKNRKDTALKLFNGNGAIWGKNEYLTVRTILCFSEGNIELPITIKDNRDSWLKLFSNTTIQNGFIKMIDEIQNDFENSFILKNENFINRISKWKYFLIKNHTVIQHVNEKKIQDYGLDFNNNPLVFLYEATSKTIRAILISNDRNEIISRLINNYDFNFIGHYSHNINNTFFRGIQNELEKNGLRLLVDNYKIKGVLNNSEQDFIFADNIFDNLTIAYPIFFNI